MIIVNMLDIRISNQHLMNIKILKLKPCFNKYQTQVLVLDRKTTSTIVLKNKLKLAKKENFYTFIQCYS